MTQIAVIEAGIVEPNAVLTLQDTGRSCTFYEASNRIGGRMHSDSSEASPCGILIPPSLSRYRL